MRRFDTRTTPLHNLSQAFENRLQSASAAAEEDVRKILDSVRAQGDAAVLDYTRRWDYPKATALRVPEEAIDAAFTRVSQTPLGPVMEQAAERIRDFHERQRRQSWMDSSRPGEVLGQIVRPLARVGIYVPGGTAAYPSTVLMTAVPAQVAGVPSIVVATPPNKETGLPPEATLAAARIAGVSDVYAVGGAQAVAALAYGTESIPRVDKIVGPGNVYVNLAKRLVYGTVGIDMLAGPSEIAVLADDSADAAQAAADILSQCEHDPNGSALVATASEAFATALLSELEKQLSDLPRADIARRAIGDNGFLVVTNTLEEAAEVISLYAPEHLHIDIRDPWGMLGRIRNAGAILVGRNSSAPLGDYVAGPSHTLPTAGCARFSSPLGWDDFVKRTSLIAFDHTVAEQLGPLAATFAEFEGLEAHARAAKRHNMSAE
jgi:histidinol dehydrogenase